MSLESDSGNGGFIEIDTRRLIIVFQFEKYVYDYIIKRVVIKLVERGKKRRKRTNYLPLPSFARRAASSPICLARAVAAARIQ